MQVRVRFAPSPTGYLHVGGARTALFNYLLAKKTRGAFILRIDDTDRDRSRLDYEEDILESLAWLGLDWDEGVNKGGDYGPYRQSEKLDRYRQVVKTLISSDSAYLDVEGVTRLRYPAEEVVVNDIICGTCTFSPEALGTEPALLRSDGSPTYHLATVVDDIDMKISHIIRGQDHLTNTAKHCLIYRYLQEPLPRFAHLPLIMSKEGGKLSKREKSDMVNVRDFRRQGFVPDAMNNFLVMLGWSHPEGKEQLSLHECIERFELERVGATSAVFDTTKLEWLNGWWIRNLPIGHIARESLEFLRDLRPSVESRGMAYWEAVVAGLRDSIATLRDSYEIAQMLVGEELVFAEDIKEFLIQPEAREVFNRVALSWQKLLDEVELEPDRDCLSDADFSRCLSILKKENQGAAKLVFKSMRICVMGTLSGPELKVLVPFIRRDLLRERVKLTLSRFARAV